MRGKHPPRPRLHPAATPAAELRPQLRLGGQAADVGSQLVVVLGRVQQPRATVVDEVDRTAGPGRDHGETRGHRLLDGLTEGLLGAGVGEEIERGVRIRQLFAPQLSEQQRVRPQAARHRVVTGAVADHHHLHVEIAQHPEALHSLLGGQPPHIPDNRAIPGPGMAIPGPGETPVHGLHHRGGAAIGAIAMRIHAPAPVAEEPRIHPGTDQVVPRRARWDQRHRRLRVQCGDPSPGDPLGVLPEQGAEHRAGEPGKHRAPEPPHVSRDVGLIHGHGRHPERGGGEYGLLTERTERGGEVHDVGAGARDHPMHRMRGRHAHMEALHGDVSGGVHSDLDIGGDRRRTENGDLVSPRSELAGHLPHAGGHAVQRGQRRFADDEDAEGTSRDGVP
ncbi:MAG: hypothetical protein ABF811_04920 [Pseudoclavibacter sp.]